jgi:uncharacterized protein
MNKSLNIEIVYALSHEQTLLRIQVPMGSTVTAAIQMSGILNQYPVIDLAVNKLGIFGKLVKPDTILREQDRIEIYRPLLADPKEIRRQRTQTGKVMKKGRGEISV